MSVRTAASATDRLDGAAAAPAGLESAAREVSLSAHVRRQANEATETVASWDPLETSGRARLCAFIHSNL